ncbi:MAG: hypothetical protein ACOX1P_19940 [Thermoguttaceae bacterium]
MSRALYVAFATFALFLAGCSGPGGPTATVEGTVSIDGTAVDNGVISFTPLESDAGTAVSAEIHAGKYQANGVPIGRVMVQFYATKETGKTIVEEGNQYPETVSLIPQKYQTGVEVTVGQKKESHDFELTSH